MMVLFGGNGDSGLDLAVNVVKAELEQGKDGDSVYVNMFFQRKMTFEIPSTLKSFKVYDDGGKDGNYSANNMDTLVLKAPAGHVLRLSVALIRMMVVLIPMLCCPFIAGRRLTPTVFLDHIEVLMAGIHL